MLGIPRGEIVREAISDLRLLLSLIALYIVAAPLFGADTTRPTVGGDTARPAGVGILVTRAERVDDETGALMQQRPAAGQPADPTLELQIDLRVTASWLLHRSTEGASEDVQSCGYLRARSVLSAADLLAQHLRKSPPGPAQINALARLHEMTYRLPDLKSVARMDESCKALANLLVTIGGPLPNPGQGLPLMRPMEVDRPEDQQAEPPSLAELTTAARQASVSPALRRQLVALAQASASASADPNRQDEAAALYGVLTRAVEMTRGLQQGSLVDPQTRGRIEPQLTGGIVLFLDPRTRDA